MDVKNLESYSKKDELFINSHRMLANIINILANNYKIILQKHTF